QWRDRQSWTRSAVMDAAGRHGLGWCLTRPMMRRRLSRPGASGVLVGRIRPRRVAVTLGVLKEFLAERLVVGPPPVTALRHFLRGQRLGGQPRIISVLRPD